MLCPQFYINYLEILSVLQINRGWPHLYEKIIDKCQLFPSLSKFDKLVYMLSTGYDVAVYVAEFIYCNLSSRSTESVVEFHPWVHSADLDVLCLLVLSTFMHTNPYMLPTFILFYVLCFFCFIICQFLWIACMIYSFNKAIWILNLESITWPG